MSSESFLEKYRNTLSDMARNYRDREEGLEAAARAAAEVEEERVLDNLRSFLDSDALERAREFARKLDDVERRARPGPAPDAPGRRGTLTLPDLTVRDLHLLSRLVSIVRHSVVEDCLLNLHTFAEALSDRGGNPDLLDKVEAQVGLLPGIVKQVIDFFNRPIAFGITVKHLMPVAFRASLEATKGLVWLVRRMREEDGRERVEGRDVKERVSALSEALAGLRDSLEAAKTSVPEVVGRGVTAVRPVVEAAGIRLEVTDATEGSARLFLDETAVENAVAELVRNAARHGHAQSAGGRWIRVLVSDAEPPETDIRVTVTDNGAGFPGEVLERLGERGVSMSGGGDGLSLVFETAEAHLGAVLAKNTVEGAAVTLVLPRRPGLEENDATLTESGKGG